MIDKLLAPLLETAGKVIVQGTTTFGKAVIEHFTKHGTKYLIGGGGAAAFGGAYAVGESVGHSKGKKEGTAEQAARDEKKFNDMHQQHENDRKRWNEEKQAYEDLLDEAENKL
jgi:hypothetical protein